MYYPDLNRFEKLAKKGNLIPVYREVLADLDTPLSAFLKLDGRYRFLFESVEGGEKWARYSFLGSNPEMMIESKDRSVLIKKGGYFRRADFVKDPLEIVAHEMSKYKYVDIPELPRFSGGFVGYIGYDIVRFFEDIKEKHNKEELGLPDLFLMLFKDILIFDNLAQKIKVVSNAFIDDREPKEAYKEAIERIDTIVEKMKSNKLQLPEHRPCEGGVFSSNFTKDEFMRAVRKIKDYIRAGDVIQTVISQRFKKDTEVHPIHVYRALRLINPSPYMFYLEAGDTTLVGSSPEILVRLEDGRITLRPIAGTRRRGDTEEEDLMLEEELLSDPKENAEHIMLVDLGRNDVGRIAVVGSVAVKEFMQIERYSHVMHIISSVEGVLKEDRDVFDLLRASFPAGTVTGAPKIRAMQIIEELEPVRRGPYAGCVGYISFSGNMDTCITIRTIIFKDGKAYVQAGAGVVADSNPEKEYIETVNKAMALVKAIEMAERGVDR